MKKLSMLFMIVTALIVSACSAAPVPSGGGQPAPSGIKATEVSAVTPTDIPPSAGNASQATDLLELTDVTEGLSSLDSYDAVFSMSFNGTVDFKQIDWTYGTEEKFVKNPPARHSTMSSEGTGASGQNTSIETIVVNGKTYFKFGGICSSDAGEAPTANTSFTPSSVIGDIKAAQLLGTETINGVPTQHFAVDMANFTGTYANGKSEAWVAQKGNFVVKYVFEGAVKGTLTNDGTKTEGTIRCSPGSPVCSFQSVTKDNTAVDGTWRWTYELKSANQPIVIEPPQDCGGAPADIPVMDDAANQSAFGTLTRYTSATAFDTVVEFYKKGMVAKGWAAQEGGMSAEGFTMLSFTKDKRTASVTITVDKDKNVTNVMMSVEATE